MRARPTIGTKLIRAFEVKWNHSASHKCSKTNEIERQPGSTRASAALVYGPEDNSDLSTSYGFAVVPDWRWTHGHVENVASATVKAAFHPEARNAMFNVGGKVSPTMGERLASLSRRAGEPTVPPPFDYSQSLALATGRIRAKLGYVDVMNEKAAMRELAIVSSQKP